MDSGHAAVQVKRSDQKRIAKKGKAGGGRSRGRRRKVVGVGQRRRRLGRGESQPVGGGDQPRFPRMTSKRRIARHDIERFSAEVHPHPGVAHHRTGDRLPFDPEGREDRSRPRPPSSCNRRGDKANGVRGAWRKWHPAKGREPSRRHCGSGRTRSSAPPRNRPGRRVRPPWLSFPRSRPPPAGWPGRSHWRPNEWPRSPETSSHERVREKPTERKPAKTPISARTARDRAGANRISGGKTWRP